MSWKTAQRLLDEGAFAGYSHAEAHILFVAAMDENTTDGYFASDRTLAKRSHSNRRTVKAAMTKAERLGLLVDTGERVRSMVVYRFTIGAPVCANETPATGASTCATEPAASGAVSTSRVAQSEHATGALSLACKESGESITANRGSRASARRPRGSDIGLTTEQIAERNLLDLEWKRSKHTKAEDEARRHAALLDVYGDPAVTPEDFAATPDEALAVIAERQRQRDDDDRLHSEALEARFAEEDEGEGTADSLVIRRATVADWAAFEQAKRRRLPVDVLAAIAGTNGGVSNDDD